MKRLRERILDWARGRRPDVVIGGEERPYLRRWWLIPRNPIFNVYVHEFLRSDDDRALHDHPWVNLSVLLEGQYTEHEILAGGVHQKTVRSAGDWRFRRSGRIAHRIELTHGRCWTLFITGPRYRHWGFHCERAGWVHWRLFTSDDGQDVGKGCDQ
ncbi:hypothetical protein [Variovorax paradoxus]|uniref:hypothetical protein n=1 Tax=Variovorax paradoxus TaxID=34073 RepID=UPI001933D4C3|nr:hypothetical protein INQ48_13860 [Variovorax paradoxus]